MERRNEISWIKRRNANIEFEKEEVKRNWENLRVQDLQYSYIPVKKCIERQHVRFQDIFKKFETNEEKEDDTGKPPHTQMWHVMD